MNAKIYEKMDAMIEWAHEITTEEEYEEFCQEEFKMYEDIRIMCPNRTKELYDLWCERINEVVWNIPEEEADDED